MLNAFLILLVMSQSPNMPPAADARDGALGSLRTRVPRIARAITEGYERSITFRRLVDEVSVARGVVYIDTGRCKATGLTTLTGCLAPLAETESMRYFQMIVDVDRSDDRLIALIGHELQHACELISIPGTIKAAVDTLAWKSEQTGARILETQQARAVTEIILKELRAK